MMSPLRQWRGLGQVGCGFLILAMGIVLPCVSSPVWGETLTFDVVVSKAVAASNELKIAQIDIKIGRAAILSARSGYFPNIRARYNTEYLKDFQSPTGAFPVSVGDTVIPAGTRFQNSVGVNLTQNLLDFGSTHRRVLLAKTDVKARQSTYQQNLRDLKVKLVDIYRDALIQSTLLKAKGEVLLLAQKAYQMKKRLFEAGTLSRVVVADEAIQVAQTLDEIQAAQHRLQATLDQLGFYTREKYLLENTELAAFEDQSAPLENEIVDTEDSPEARIYKLEIEKKQREIEILKRRYLPQVGLYSTYNLYGFDPDNWGRSFQEIRQRTLSGGLSVTLPVFDGFKNMADIRRAQLEKERLGLERDQKLDELRQKKWDAYRQMLDAQSEATNRAEFLKITEDKASMTGRLAEQQMVDKSQPIQDEIRNIERQLELETSQIQRLAALTKLKILVEG